MAEDDADIEKNNYDAVKASIKNAVAGTPTAAEVVAAKATSEHPFAANKV
jgi:5,6,7,8-tetrahydromethanopterin hydro-lyase